MLPATLVIRGERNAAVVTCSLCCCIERKSADCAPWDRKRRLGVRTLERFAYNRVLCSRAPLRTFH